MPVRKIAVNEDTLADMYSRQRLSVRTIGHKLGIGAQTVWEHLVKLGVPRRRVGWWRGGVSSRYGYVYVWQPSHPRAGNDGYVMRAITNWEEANGMPFPENKSPHHDNEVKDDDRPENIIPLTRSEHMILHYQRRAKA
jgi:hypothetical protein